MLERMIQIINFAPDFRGGSGAAKEEQSKMGNYCHTCKRNVPTNEITHKKPSWAPGADGAERFIHKNCGNELTSVGRGR